MTSQQSVITLDRFQQGMTWRKWLESIDVNKDKFQENYDSTRLQADEIAAIKSLIAMPRGPNVWGMSQHAPAKVLAIVEAWCPDVYRGLPVMARLCEATGLDLKIFLRDENLDIMDEFLNRGEFRSIPTFVFFTKAHEYMAHWIEKPIKAREEGEEYTALTEKLRTSLTPEERRELELASTDFERGSTWDAWRQAQVRETRLVLQASLERAARLEDLIDTMLND